MRVTGVLEERSYDRVEGTDDDGRQPGLLEIASNHLMDFVDASEKCQLLLPGLLPYLRQLFDAGAEVLVGPVDGEEVFDRLFTHERPAACCLRALDYVERCLRRPREEKGQYIDAFGFAHFELFTVAYQIRDKRKILSGSPPVMRSYSSLNVLT